MQYILTQEELDDFRENKIRNMIYEMTNNLKETDQFMNWNTIDKVIDILSNDFSPITVDRNTLIKISRMARGYAFMSELVDKGIK